MSNSRTHTSPKSDSLFLCYVGKVWETVLPANEASFEGVYNANTEVKTNGNNESFFEVHYITCVSSSFTRKHKLKSDTENKMKLDRAGSDKIIQDDITSTLVNLPPPSFLLLCLFYDTIL